MSSSFKKYSGVRPLRYRTPSPPRQALEPISPTWNGDATTTNLFGDCTATNVQHPPYPQPHEEPHLVLKGHKQFQRSTESMDIFADIALAAHLRRQSFHTRDLPGKPVINNYQQQARPCKRARSDKTPSPDMSRKSNAPGPLPIQSCEQSLESRMVEAELLLNFCQKAREAKCSSTKHHINNEQVKFVSDTMLCVSQHMPFHDQAQHTADEAIQSRSPDNQSMSQFQHPVVTNTQPGVVADCSISPATSGTAARDKQELEHAKVASALHEPMDVVKEDQDTDTDSMPRAQFKRGTQDVPSETLDNPGNTLVIETVDDKLSKDHNTSSKERVEDNDIPAPNERRRQGGQGGADAPEAAEVLSNNESNILTPVLSTVHHLLDQAPKDVAADLPMLTKDEEQPARGAARKTTEGDDMDIPLAPIRSPNSMAVCAVCKFAQNSLSIDSDKTATSWISCDGCKSWFHFACAGFKNEREVRSVDKYRCRRCKPTYGSTTYVRKSSRAHSAIDYAGLHQGLIKISDDRPEHHYIQPIKDGTITFLPETFARMRPELVTAEYFEKGVGMKEPIIIPAMFNCRPRIKTSTEGLDSPRAAKMQSPYIFDKRAYIEDWFPDDTESQRVPDEGQDGLDMVMPQGLTVRKVAELYGLEEKVEVIDVKSQNGENKKWNMRRWVDYYEKQNDNKIVRNVISLEVSQSKLGRLIKRPQIVRDLDLQDSVWPDDLLAKGEYPRVQFYCLMSVADCFTDFHIDFGGSSVFYHILKGKKTFFFIPPKEKHLKKYEEWCMSPAQNWTFLPDQTKECYRVDLSEGDTMLIPSGWIHAVWTPEDSLVIGGNFLTRMNYGMQLRIAQVEKATGVARKFRYPHFQKLHWYTALRYLEDDPLPDDVRDILENGRSFRRSKPTHCYFDDWGQNSRSGPENYNARYYSQPEIDGLPELTRYLLRTALIDNGSITEGISAETRNAVKKSIPKGHGEPLDVVKTFAIWCAWKRGNEPIPHWAYHDAVLETVGPDKLSAAATKKLDHEAALKAPRRQSARMQILKESAEHTRTVPMNEVKRSYDWLNLSDHADNETPPPPKRLKVAPSSSTGSHRKTACESCRRRRRACKHKEQVESSMINTQGTHAVRKSLPVDTAVGGSAFQDKMNSIGDLFDSASVRNERIQIVTPSSDLQSEPKKTQHPQRLNDLSSVSLSIEALPHGQDFLGGLGTISGSAGPSRPRTKACSECRKSKRRCIHDAFGNEDPVKVAETAIPRPHARKVNKAESTARRLHISARQDITTDDAKSTSERHSSEETEGEAAPFTKVLVAPTANMVATSSGHSDYETSQDTTTAIGNLNSISMTTPIEGLSAAHISITGGRAPSPICGLDHSMAIDPALFHDSGQTQVVSEAKHDIAEFEFEQPPASLLVSPPASSHDDIGNSPAAAEIRYTTSISSSRQGSQRPREHFQRYTPESGTIRRVSQSSYGDDSLEKEILETREEVPHSVDKQGRAQLVVEADDGSLRLIKKLQAQDLGLRRRDKS